MDIVIQGEGAGAFAHQLTIKNIWVKENAVRINGADDVLSQELMAEAEKLGFDVNCLPDGLSIKDFGLVTLDMDSTLIELECIDDIAWQYGVGEEVARMTEIAMQGHMPFAQYLRERAVLFKDAPAHFLDVTASHAKLMPGARELIDFAKAHGLKTYILSGGFDAIAKRVVEMLGMDGYLCNRLVIKDGMSGQALPDNTAVVILDTEIDAELEKEGIARDFVRMIQALRKSKDFDISDRIKLAYSSENATVKTAISEYADYIKEQVLALEIAENGNLSTPTIDELGGAEVRFDVVKAA